MMKKSKTLSIIGTLSWVFFWHSNAYSIELEDLNQLNTNYEEQIDECRLEFSPAQWDVNIGVLKGCFGNLDSSAVDSFDIYTTPFPNAKMPRSRTLWLNRFNSLSKSLVTYFPGAKINFKSIVDNDSVGETPAVVANLKNSLHQNSSQPHSLFPEALPVTLCLGCEKKEKQTHKFNNIKVWSGVEFVYVIGDLSSYVPPFFMGYVAGMSVPFKKLDSTNELYLSFVSDFANSSQKLTVKEQSIESVYYMLNFQFLVGKEHYFTNRKFSCYADGGLILIQRAFLVVADGGVVNNYSIYTNFALGGNTGLNYVHNYSETFGLIAKLNLNVLLGYPKSEDVNVNGAVATNVNSNPIIAAPSLSVGVKF